MLPEVSPAPRSNRQSTRIQVRPETEYPAKRLNLVIEGSLYRSTPLPLPIPIFGQATFSSGCPLGLRIVRNVFPIVHLRR
jgi:hypothetical protein